jgi:hypothetical protein
VTAGQKFGDFNLNGNFNYAESRGENYFIAADGAGVSGNIRDPYKDFVGNLKLGYKDMLQLNMSAAHQVASQFITVGDCRQRPARVPLSPVSPGTRDPPGGAETDLRAAPWREGGVGHLPRRWRQRGAAGSFPDRLGVLKDCSACSLSRRG